MQVRVTLAAAHPSRTRGARLRGTKGGHARSGKLTKFGKITTCRTVENPFLEYSGTYLELFGSVSGRLSRVGLSDLPYLAVWSRGWVCPARYFT